MCFLALEYILPDLVAFQSSHAVCKDKENQSDFNAGWKAEECHLLQGAGVYSWVGTATRRTVASPLARGITQMQHHMRKEEFTCITHAQPFIFAVAEIQTESCLGQ